MLHKSEWHIGNRKTGLNIGNKIYVCIQGVSIKVLLRIFRKGSVIFSKKILNYKLQPIYTSNKKKISILTQIAKKLQAHQFLQYCLVKEASDSKKFFFFFDLSINVLVIYLNSKFWASMSKSVRFMDKTFLIFLRKLGKKS